ncbi:MAG: hypothetical protein K0R43_1691 [Pseudoduganella sp.]|jgi:hypothetical protein|nr:hypothetical protein [Pseudoduganella sp.]
MAYPLTPVTAYEGLSIPDRSDPATFPDRGDLWVAAEAAAQEQFNTLAGQVNTMAVAAEAAASSADESEAAAEAYAAIASAAANATIFNPATNYAQGQAAISGVNFQSYRRKTAGTSATDPANDGTNWERTIVGVGVGGALASVNAVLTSSSGGSQTFTPTAPGQSVYLPNAMSMTKGAGVFNLHNAGEYDFAIRNFFGTIKGFIRPFSNVIVGLSDNSTSDGVWSLDGSQLLGIVGQRELSTIPSNSSSSIVAVPLDANRTCLIYGSTTLYAVVYDKSTQQWGGTTTIATTVSGASPNFNFRALLASTNLVLVAFTGTAQPTQGLTLSISGTGITPNAIANGTGGSASGVMLDLVQLGSSYAMAWNDGTTCRLNGITVSGTTVAFGSTPTSATTASFQTGSTLLYANSSTVALLIGAASGDLVAQCFTLSGANLTPGTENKVTPGGATGLRKVQLMGSGRYAALYTGATPGSLVRLYTISGASITATEVNVSSEAFNSAQFDWFATSSTKILLGYGLTGDANFYTRILTDTSGTVSTSAAVSVAMTGAVTSVVALPQSSGTTAKMLSNTAGTAQLNHIDASGASPSITVKQRAPVATFLDPIVATTIRSARDPRALNNGTLAVAAPNNGRDRTTVIGERFNITRDAPMTLGAPSASGQNSRESWITAFNGGALQLLEMAA